MRKKIIYAFTLAEVLITLAIVGVLAVMLVNTTKYIYLHDLSSRFQKAASIIYSVTNDLKQEKQIVNWQTEYCMQNDATCKGGEYAGMGTMQKLSYDLKPYFAGPNFVTPKSSFPTDKRKLKDLNGNLVTGDFYTWYHSYASVFYLKDGMTVELLAMSNWYSTIVVDTNGFKPPNRLGYDVFGWRLYGKNITPGINLQEDSCSLTSGIGASCSKYAIQNICPWDNSKKYWDIGCLP